MNAMTVPEINVDELMLCIRNELAARAPGNAALSGAQSASNTVGRNIEVLLTLLQRLTADVAPVPPLRLSLSEFVGSSPVDVVSQGGTEPYRLQDLLAYDGPAFVAAAYHATLGREPDEDGLKCYGEMLRAGASKVEILGRICDSSEAREQGARIKGLRSAYLLDKVIRWPIVGRLLGICSAVWNLPAAERRYRHLASELAFQVAHNEQRSAQLTSNIHDALRALENSQNSLAAVTGTLAGSTQVNAVQQILSKTLISLQAVQAQSKTELTDLRRQIDKKADNEGLTATHQKLQAVIGTKASASDLDRCSANLEQHLAKLRAATDEGAAQLRGAMEGLAQSLAMLRDSKADAIALGNLNHSLLRAIESKTERHELSALTGHLVTLLEKRATKDDLEALALAVEKSTDSVARIDLDKVGRNDLESLRAAIQNESRVALDGVNWSIQGLARSKADEAAVSAHVEALESLLEAAAERAESTLRQSVDASKADRAVLEQTRAELELTRTKLELIPAEVKQTRAGLEQIRTELERIPAEVKQTQAGLQQIRTELEQTRTGLEQIPAEVKQTRADVVQARAELSAAIGRTESATREELKTALAPINLRAQDLQRHVLDQERRVGLLLEEARKRFPKPISAEQIGAMLSEDDHRLDAMYASFEDQFRGTRSDIRQRQSIYLPYVRKAGEATTKGLAIDIGCGRGEWLELLRDEGVVAKGVDLNRVFLDGCRERELDVCEQDALAFLRELKRNSVGVVTSFHMIEHLDHRVLIALFDEILRVLKPGGVAIFETPNPRNMVVGSCNFYLDPTHKRPLPPELSRYLLEARGFSNVEVKEIHPYGQEHWLTEGAGTVKDALNRILHSSQDYAVIGWKV